MTEVLKETIQNLPHSPGVYIYRNRNKQPLYVGKSIDLHARVRSYFQKDITLPPKTKELVEKIHFIEIIETESEIEALLLEAALIQSITPPYNSALKDDKRYLYIQVTDSFYKGTRTNVSVKRRKIYHTPQAYPVITTARKANELHSIYFGPFPDAKTVRSILTFLRKTFGWCKYEVLDKAENAPRPCFYFHIGQCPGFCNGKMSHNDYIDHIDQIIRFLRGEKKEVIKDLTTNMEVASKNLDYEKASKLRDQIQRIEYVTASFNLPSSYLTNPALEKEHFYFARQQLREILGEINQSWAPWMRNLERIEAYDISNTQGTNPTGSMVVLINGEPRNDLYRIFKIRLVEGINDPAMMAEVVTRRLKYLATDQKNTDESFSQLPQLLLIDGGKTQVNAVKTVLDAYKMQIPVIGLAKQEELLMVPEIGKNTFKMVRLPFNSVALQLMQKIRDEAHRFAKKLHVQLRGKAYTT